MDIVRSVGRPQSVTPFSFLLFLYFFRAFYQSHRNCPIMDSNQRGVHHILLFFFLSKHVQHPVYPIAALAALSPRSASEVSPDNR